MIAVSLLGMISLGAIGVFSSMSKGIQYSKARTLAANLAQEQMQILKQKSFNSVLVTTTTISIPGFTPNIPYDASYYPPERILEGSIYFTRYTYVEVAIENSGFLDYFGAIPDSGMKALTVTVTWTQGAELKKFQVKNIMANTDTTLGKAILRGKVAYATNTAVGIGGALVTVAENVGWQDTTDSSGNFLINLNAGSYRMITTYRGFFTQYISVSIAPNANVSQDVNMVAMGSGTVQGTVWINDHLVISQVVGSVADVNGFCSEFVEIYNPSTFTWTIASNATTPVIDLKYQRYGAAVPTTIAMSYTNLTIPAGAYYIFANTSTVTMAGVSKTADALYLATNAGYPDLIYTSGGGCASGTPDADGLGLSYTSSGDWIDKMGWTKDLGTHNPLLLEGTGILQVGTMQDGQQYVRKTSTSGVVVGPGRAYDSGNNNNDFEAQNPGIYPPRNTSNTDLVISGSPAYGAFVSATDGTSQTVNATSFGTPPVALFQLTSVATGTWTVIVTSGTLETEFSSVTVTSNNTTYIPNATTSPIWTVAGYSTVFLSSVATQGFVSGYVTDTAGLPILSPASGVPVSAAGNSVNASLTNGSYFLRLATGTYDVVANAAQVSSSYVSQTSATVQVQLGQVLSNVNFRLSQGGRVSGFVTRDSVNPLSGVALIANDVTGITRDQEISGSNGQFLLINLSTGVYSVEPVLGSGESSTPSSTLVTVTAGATVSVGTFTVAGSFGTIRGSVTAGSAAIRTGVLIFCSTTIISGTPPALSSATLTGVSYNMTNSYEDGTYSMDVRGSTSTTYRVYAYYTTFNGVVSSTTVRSTSGVSVIAGSITSGINFTW